MITFCWIIGILVWLSCGFVVWGWTNNDRWHYKLAHPSFSDNAVGETFEKLFLLLVLCAFGPLALLGYPLIVLFDGIITRPAFRIW